MLKVYFEDGRSSTPVATFQNEEMYMACLPVLQQLANESGEFITESIEEPTEDKINCKGCGSTNVRMTDYSPLAMGEDLFPIGQFDNELYADFECFDCETSFQKILTISTTQK